MISVCGAAGWIPQNAVDHFVATRFYVAFECLKTVRPFFSFVGGMLRSVSVGAYDLLCALFSLRFPNECVISTSTVSLG